MNKLFLFIPIFVISFLTNCGNKKNLTEHTLTLTLNNCKVDDQPTYIHKYIEGSKIDSILVKPNANYVLTKDSIDNDYKDYWIASSDNSYILNNLIMDKDYTINITAIDGCSLTLNLTNCNIDGASTYTHTYIVGAKIDPIKITPNDSFALTMNSVSSEYKDYWLDNGDGTYTLSNLIMNKNYAIDIKAGAIRYINTIDDEITIFPNKMIEGIDYVGTVKINDPTKIDEIFSSSPLNRQIVYKTSHKDIQQYCKFTLKEKRKEVEIVIPGQYITDDVLVNFQLISELKAWYKISNWWDYCSDKSKLDSPALDADIGAVVPLTIGDKIYKIRLIDVDRDVIAGTSEKVHCTFEFTSHIENFETNWSDSGGATNFISNSNLNKCLQPGGDVYKKMPTSLMNAIKTVKKTARCYEVGKWCDKLYDTKLFPFSSGEIDSRYSPYAYYKDDAKSKRNKSVIYWLRSPFERDDYFSDADCVFGGGDLHSLNAHDYNLAVVPAFCI